MTNDKQLPHDLEIESAVLGSILLETDAFLKIESYLETEDVFYSEPHKAIFKSILEIKTKGQPIDLITVTTQLRKDGNLEMVGGAYYVSELTNKVATTAHIQTHAKILYEYHARRYLIATSDVLKGNLYKDTTDVIKLSQEAYNSFYEVMRGIEESKELVSISQVVENYVVEFDDRVERIANGENALSGLETGNKKLNEIVGGWQDGDLIILGGRPGMGKTMRAMKFLEDCGKSSLFFSLEMSEKQLAQRRLAAEAMIKMKDLKNHTISEIQRKEVDRVLIKLIGNQCSIQTASGRNLHQIEADMKAHILKYGSLDLVVIDYLQIMGDTIKGSRNDQVGFNSKHLKNLAKEYNVPIIALAQLSRQLEQRPDKRPILSDLRESGSIEQDADVIIFCYRDAYYNDTGDIDPKASELIIAKNRQGETGIVEEQFLGEYATFRDYQNDVNDFIAPMEDPF